MTQTTLFETPKVPRILRLHLKGKWWEQIASGEKSHEYREATPYWAKRLANQTYDEVHLLRGYPKHGDETKILRRRWGGAELRTIEHEEFGWKPLIVFAIDVAESV